MENLEYQGFSIPVDLVELTGGGPETWDVISVGHMREYERYCPIDASHDVLERSAVASAEMPFSSPSCSAPALTLASTSLSRALSGAVRTLHPDFQTFGFTTSTSTVRYTTRRARCEFKRSSCPSRISQLTGSSCNQFSPTCSSRTSCTTCASSCRWVRPGGRVFASFFVLDEESLDMARSGQRPPDHTLCFEFSLWGWVLDQRRGSS